MADALGWQRRRQHEPAPALARTRSRTSSARAPVWVAGRAATTDGRVVRRGREPRRGGAPRPRGQDPGARPALRTDGCCSRPRAPRPSGWPTSSTSGSTTSSLIQTVDSEPVRRRPSRTTTAHPYDRAHSGAVATYGGQAAEGGSRSAYVGDRAAAQQERSRAGGRSSRHSTPAAASIRGWRASCGPTSGSAADPIGYVDPDTDPEKHPDQVGPSTVRIDALAGHGTFIAGLIHQACPDADIVAWRVVGVRRPDRRERPGQGTQGHLGAGAAAPRRRSRTATRSTCSACRSGYYHETPQDELFDPTMYGILRRAGRVRRRGGLLGRQRRDRPTCFPAPGAHGRIRLDDARGGQDPEHDVVPIVVGRCAQPQRTTDALFSNAGPGFAPTLAARR